MGYYIRLSGSLTFTDQLSDDELQKLNDLELDGLSYGGKFTASGWDDDGDTCSMPGLDDEARSLADFLRPLGIRANGIIVATGEDNTDISRLVFAGGTVEHQYAEIRWPDGTKVESVY